MGAYELFLPLGWAFFFKWRSQPTPLFFTLDVHKSPALYILIRALDDPHREFRGFSSLNITLF